MILFQNSGELDPRAFSTFGISSKDSASPIGYFGTGLKYAIAIFLRHNCKVTICSGLTCYDFSVRPAKFRNDNFNFICANEQEMPYTTELGKNWESWQAFREIYSNCLDENGQAFKTTEKITPEVGMTKIYIDGEVAEQCWSQRHVTFLVGHRPLYEGLECDIYAKHGGFFYYKGVRIWAPQNAALYTYNINSNLKLTEDRTVSSVWEVMVKVAATIASCKDKDIIRTALLADMDKFEAKLDFDMSFFSYSQEFLDVVGEEIKNGRKLISLSARKARMRMLGEDINPDKIILNNIDQMKLDTAVKFLKELGFDDLDRYPIHPVEAIGESVLGLAKDDVIYIAKATFQKGGKEVATTLLEEYLHLKHGFMDETRAFQNYLFELIISQGEQFVWKRPL